MSNIAEYLNSIRCSNNLSIRKVSKLTGISHTELINIEKGVRLKPSLLTLKKLSHGLDLSFEKLIALCGYVENVDSDAISNINLSNKDNSCYSSIIEKKIIDKLSLKFKNIHDIQPEFKCTSNKKLDYLITTNNELIAIEIKQSNRLNNLSYLQIKSLFVDFYFDFKHSFTDDQLKFILVLFFDNDISPKTISKVDKEFKHLNPIFEYLIYTNSDL